MNNDEELVYKNKSERLKAVFIGFLLGLFVIIPGVSGATLLIIFNLYRKVIFAISHLFKKKYFKSSLLYLLPVIIGLLIGLLIGLIAIQRLLNLLPFSTILLFAGLLIGSLPILLNEVKPYKKTHKNLDISAFSFIFIIIFCFISIYISRFELFSNNYVSKTSESLLNKGISFYFLSILIGFVIGITQVIPGLSASSFLMMIGYYSLILNSISIEVIKSDPKILIIFLALIIGFLIGLFLTNKVMFVLYKKQKEKTNFGIIGLSLASIVSIFITKEMFENVYIKYFNMQLSVKEIIDLVLGIFTLVLGIFISQLIIRKSKNLIKET